MVPHSWLGASVRRSQEKGNVTATDEWGRPRGSRMFLSFGAALSLEPEPAAPDGQVTRSKPESVVSELSDPV